MALEMEVEGMDVELIQTLNVRVATFYIFGLLSLTTFYNYNFLLPCPYPHVYM